MNYQFLCATHSAQLRERLEATAPIWSSWMRQGDAARKAGDYALCTQYFGCAYDLAVLLVERYTAHGELDDQRHIDRLMTAGSQLMECLAHGGHLALRREYLKKIRQMLYREQLRMPLMAERLPRLEDDLGMTLDAYSQSVRANSPGCSAIHRAIERGTPSRPALN